MIRFDPDLAPKCLEASRTSETDEIYSSYLRLDNCIAATIICRFYSVEIKAEFYDISFTNSSYASWEIRNRLVQ